MIKCTRFIQNCLSFVVQSYKNPKKCIFTHYGSYRKVVPWQGWKLWSAKFDLRRTWGEIFVGARIRPVWAFEHNNTMMWKQGE